MGREQISQLFGTLQQLEKYVGGSKKLLSKQRKHLPYAAPIIRQHEQILLKMRRVANKLQLEYASKDWANYYRSVNIFNGLQLLIQPELVEVYSTLSKKQIDLGTHTA